MLAIYFQVWSLPIKFVCFPHPSVPSFLISLLQKCNFHFQLVINWGLFWVRDGCLCPLLSAVRPTWCTITVWGSRNDLCWRSISFLWIWVVSVWRKNISICKIFLMDFSFGKCIALPGVFWLLSVWSLVNHWLISWVLLVEICFYHHSILSHFLFFIK